MYSKRIFIITTVLVSILAFLWVGHTAFTNAAGLQSHPQTETSQPTIDSITAVLSGTNTVSETFKLVSTNPITDGRYGRSVAIYEDTLVVGEDHGSSASIGTGVMGHLYIHERHAGGFNNWGVTKVITPSDGADGHGLGTALAFNGETLVTGALTANGNVTGAGAVYIFERNYGGTNNWGEVTKLIPSSADSGDTFGWTVSLDGDTAVVGNRWNDGAGIQRGKVYIYERNEGGTNNWGLIKELTASNPANYAWFGYAVAIEGDTLVVGSDNKNTTVSRGGVVYIYERNRGGTDNWGEVTQITPSTPVTGARFGAALDIDGDRIAVGALDLNTSRPGAVFIFERDEGGIDNWGEIITLTPSDGTANNVFGGALTLQDDTLFIGARNATGMGNSTGAAYIFKQDPTNPRQWYETAKLIASDGGAGDEYGRSVAFWDDTFIVGSYLNDSPCSTNSNCDSGTAYIYTPFHQVYLPAIMSPLIESFPFPIHINETIPQRLINEGEIFFNISITIPDTIPPTGRFFLSSQADRIDEIRVDDDLVIMLDSEELFIKSFSPNGQPVQPAVVELPREIMTQMAGETVSFVYRDVYGQYVSASEVWLIWVP